MFGTRKAQWFILAGALIVLAIVLWWRLGGGERVMPPAQLAAEALRTSGEDQREAAALQLARHPEPAVPELRQVFAGSESPRVKAAAALGLGRSRDWQSIPQLLEAMEDPSPWLRGQAALAVNRIVGEDFGFRPDDPPEQRRRVIALVREKWPVLHEGHQVKEHLMATGQQPVSKKKQRDSQPPSLP